MHTQNTLQAASGLSASAVRIGSNHGYAFDGDSVRLDAELLIGNPARAKEKLGWEPKTSFEDMVAEMAREDLALSMRDAVCKVAGFKTFSHNE